MVLCLAAGGAGPGSGENGPASGKRYKYQEDVKRWVLRVEPAAAAGHLVLGKLNGSGKFELVTKGPPIPVYNLPVDGEETVYEYRGRSLVKGTLDANGNFRPEVGSKVSAFKDYRYGKNAPRINNLPGRFVEIRDKAGKK